MDGIGETCVAGQRKLEERKKRKPGNEDRMALNLSGTDVFSRESGDWFPSQPPSVSTAAAIHASASQYHLLVYHPPPPPGTFMPLHDPIQIYASQYMSQLLPESVYYPPGPPALFFPILQEVC
jgi:hypothetical protein